MIPAADYRRRAEDCARRADEAQDEFHRKNFRKLAEMWGEWADKAEGRAEVVANLSRKPEIPEQGAVDDALATIRNA